MHAGSNMGINAGARLDRLPIGNFHYRLLALIGAGLFLDGFELYLTAGVLGSLTKSGWSTMALNASFVSATFMGMVVGAWAAGIIGDRYGRRFAYQFNLMVFGLASLGAVFAPDMNTLIGLRFIMGIGLGAEVVIGYGMLTEFVPAKVRGRMIGWLAVITNSALFVSTFLGLWIIPNYGWRYMFLIVGVGAVIIWAMRRSLPESPRWLESKGRLEEAEAILLSLESGGTGGVNGATAPVEASVRASAAAPVPSPSIWILFTPQVIGRTLMGMLLNIVIGFCLYGFINWLPTFFVKQGFSVTSSLVWTTVMSLGAPAGAIIGLLLADHVGRKKIIVFASLWAAALGIAFPMVGDGYPLMAVGFCLFIGIYIILAVGFALHVPELFPTEYRMRGAGVCSTAGRLATAGVQFVVVSLFAWGGVTAVVGLLVSLLLVQAVVFALFGIETRQKSLEAIRPTAAPDAAYVPEYAKAGT
jgi:putative MFS transporter